MLWLFVLAGTAGIVLAIPPVMRVYDGRPADAESFVPTFAGFALVAAAITGLFVMQFEVRNMVLVVAASAVGIALGALHPEILSSIGARVVARTRERAEESVEQ